MLLENQSSSLSSLLFLYGANLYLIIDYCGLVANTCGQLSMIVDQMGGSRNYCWTTFIYEKSMSSNYFDIMYTRQFRLHSKKMCYIGIGHSRGDDIIINSSTQ